MVVRWCVHLLSKVSIDLINHLLVTKDGTVCVDQPSLTRQLREQ